jgi:hypothetical protein
MDVESLLRSADLPEVSVDAEEALHTTVRRGTRRRERRRVTVVLAAFALVVVVGLMAATVLRQAGDRDLDLATGPNDVPQTPASEPEPGDPATWDIDRADPPSSASSTFAARVHRLGCNGGETGTVLRPGVVVTDTEVEVTFTVSSLGPGYYSCPGNDAVTYVVDVGQPIGNRNLVDRACVDGEAATTSFCTSSAGSPGLRWRADGGGVLAGNFSVRGQMVSVGGPPGVEPDPAPGTVEALAPDGAVVATTETDGFGAFQLAVPNGTYRVIGRSPRYQGGAVDCHAASDLVVKDRYVEGVTVECERG